MNNEKSLFYKRHIFWLWTLLITGLGMAIYFLYFSILSEVRNGKIFWDVANDLLKNLSLEVISTFLTIVIFVYFYESYTQSSNQALVQKGIVESLLLHENVLSKFSSSQKHSFLLQLLTSLIGKDKALFLYENMLKIHLDSTINFRDTSVYDVEILESDSSFVLQKDLVLSKDKYYEMSQSYLTTKRFPAFTKEIDFRIIFTFSEQALDFWLNDNFVFMREIISIPEAEKAIKNFSADDLHKMVCETFGMRLKFYDETEREILASIEYLVSSIDLDKATNAIEIKISPDKLRSILLYDEASKCQFYVCKVSFRIPFSKLKKRFHYVLSEATCAPRFSFKCDKSFQNLDFITYFTQSNDTFKVEKDDFTNKYFFHTKKIVYPRSGIVFFWD